MKFYRYQDQLICWDYNLNIPEVRIREITFNLIKETPKGYWIVENCLHLVAIEELTHWVSKTAKKRYAYPTKKEAMENLKARKERQITILEKQLARAKETLRKSQ